MLYCVCYQAQVQAAQQCHPHQSFEQPIQHRVQSQVQQLHTQHQHQIEAFEAVQLRQLTPLESQRRPSTHGSFHSRAPLVVAGGAPSPPPLIAQQQQHRFSLMGRGNHTVINNETHRERP